MRAEALVKDEIWITGASWLLESNIPYNKPSDPIDADLVSIKEEKRKVTVSLITNVASLQPLLNLYSYNSLDKKVPRQLWRFGKIIEIQKGRGGKVRSATIKASTGILDMLEGSLLDLVAPDSGKGTDG
ncbi:hypothetical protein TNCT_212881 [Trichonephila clavata]|uniref:Uncharacterized protein n=1 Tax=Trichonephila clavata TaxID=2740835 RepID=A0A8X6GMQ1_TRICU|nr:hypothetical protein TNCT_212881 [Trichonephila clavata]